MADSCKVNGTYCTVKSKEIVEFWQKCGVPEEHCKKLLGTHWEMKVNVCGKKVYGAVSCCECPEYNMCGVFTEGQTTEVPDMPGFGGKATMCFMKCGENMYKSTMSHENFGCVEWTETYCDEGVKFEYTHKDKGLTACEKWCRKVSETGYYKFHKVEGDINAIIAPVFGPDMKIDESFKERYQKCGDTYKVTVCMGDKHFTNSWELDKESEFEGVTMLTTKTGVGKYKVIEKKGSNVLEWTVHFMDCGFTASVVCQKSGKTAKLYMEKYCEMSGSYKPVSYSGVKDVLKVMGAPAGLADKMMADSKAMLCIKTDGPFHTFSFKSSIMPMDMSFKVGEEFEYKNPMDPTDVQKIMVAVNGNCLIGSSKGKHDATWKGTFTEHFLVWEYHVTGTPACEKVIYQRMDC